METLTGIVLRACEYGENEKLLSLLTAKGKYLVTVHGARGIKSRFVAVSQPLCYGEFTVAERDGRFTLREGVLLENYFSIRNDLSSFAFASYAAEVIDSVTMENNDESTLLSLFLNTLYFLSCQRAPIAQIKAAFELRVASCAGFAPDLVACEGCGKGESEWFYLDVMNGTLLCSECLGKSEEKVAREHEEAGQARILLPLDMGILSAMRYVLYSPPKRFYLFALEESLLAPLAKICETYLLHQLGRSFDTLKFYNELEKYEKKKQESNQ